MQNLMVVFIFCCFLPEINPSGQMWFKKIKIVSFKRKYGSKTNSNMQNSMGVFSFFIFDQKFFLSNFAQKIKIVFLIWNLVPRLTQVCRIQWRHSLSQLLPGNTLFWKIWCQKDNIVSLSWNLVPILIWICRI